MLLRASAILGRLTNRRLSQRDCVGKPREQRHSHSISDLNDDWAVHAEDIDALFSIFSATVSQADPRFNLVSDFVIDALDVHRLIEDIMGRRWGDVDLDGDVDLYDYHSVAVRFDPSGQDKNHGWAEGDFDGDEDRDISDFKTTVMNYSPLRYASSHSFTSVGDKEKKCRPPL